MMRWSSMRKFTINKPINIISRYQHFICIEKLRIDKTSNFNCRRIDVNVWIKIWSIIFVSSCNTRHACEAYLPPTPSEKNISLNRTAKRRNLIRRRHCIFKRTLRSSWKHLSAKVLLLVCGGSRNNQITHISDTFCFGQLFCAHKVVNNYRPNKLRNFADVRNFIFQISVNRLLRFRASYK